MTVKSLFVFDYKYKPTEVSTNLAEYAQKFYSLIDLGTGRGVH